MAKKKASKAASKSKSEATAGSGVSSGQSGEAAADVSMTRNAAEFGADAEEGLLLNVETLQLPTPRRPFLVEYFPSDEQIRAEAEIRAAELERQHDKCAATLLQVEKSWREELRKRDPDSKGPHVDFSIAYRTKFARILAPLQYVIQVDVPVKFTPTALDRHKLFQFPSQVNGVPVKIRENRVFSKASSMQSIHSLAGTSVASSITQGIGGAGIQSTGRPGKAGTLGIAIPSATAKLIGITNQHVGGNSGSVTLTSNGRQIGTVGRGVFNNVVDAARIDPAGSGLVGGIDGISNYQPQDYHFVTNRSLFGKSVLKPMPVWKVGAITGYRSASINILSCDKYVEDLNETFLSVVEISSSGLPFIADGDSGSVLICEYNHPQKNRIVPLVIGLLFAGNTAGSLAYAIPFGKVLDSTLNIIPPEYVSGRTITL